jgi:hypothetical protein
MPSLRSALLAAVLGSIASTAGAGDPRLAPLPPGQATVVHGPYGQGACDACHARANPADPGPAPVSKEGCLGCHDEFDGKAPVRVGRGKHHPTQDQCTGCHNPHDSKKKSLLF